MAFSVGGGLLCSLTLIQRKLTFQADCSPCSVSMSVSPVQEAELHETKSTGKALVSTWLFSESCTSEMKLLRWSHFDRVIWEVREIEDISRLE